MKIKLRKCEKCGYEWQPREGNIPKACPRCKQYIWDRHYIKK